MNATEAAQEYAAQTELIASYGIRVLEPIEIDRLTEMNGSTILEMMNRFAWELKSNDRQVREIAARLSSAATDVVEAIDGQLHVPGSVGGETWTTSYARDLQKAVDARKANIDQLQQFTYAAKQLVAEA